MKRFARILIATAGLAAVSTPAIFARDYYGNGDRTTRTVIQRETVQTYDRGTDRARNDFGRRDFDRDRNHNDYRRADRFCR